MTTTDSTAWRRFLIGESASILEICEIVQLIAAKRCTVLISGETGTGKEVIARAIHAASERSAAAMVSVNCTALPANLVESELFGHVKGAFTGAQSNRSGRFEQAHKGTIFLDEIGDLPLEAQAKLLRVLQEREFERLGSSETVQVDVRVIAATNIDLEAATHDRKFRQDLFYRLNVVPIHMPALRERRSDIPLLVEYFLAKIAQLDSTSLKQITSDAMDYLQQLAWPGNVRQLEHAVQKAVALSGDRLILTANDFRPRRAPIPVLNGNSGPLVKLGKDGLNFDAVVSDFERSLIDQALTLSNGNKSHAADLLGIKRTTLLAKMKSFEPVGLALAS